MWARSSPTRAPSDVVDAPVAHVVEKLGASGGLIGLGLLVLSVLGAIGFLGARLSERDLRRQ